MDWIKMVDKCELCGKICKTKFNFTYENKHPFMLDVMEIKPMHFHEDCKKLADRKAKILMLIKENKRIFEVYNQSLTDVEFEIFAKTEATY